MEDPTIFQIGWQDLEDNAYCSLTEKWLLKPLKSPEVLRDFAEESLAFADFEPEEFPATSLRIQVAVMEIIKDEQVAQRVASLVFKNLQEQAKTDRNLEAFDD